MTKPSDRMHSTGSEMVTVYDASDRDRVSIHAWASMFRELWQFRELIQRFVSRNFAAQFRLSFLGYLWVVFPPIATTIVFALLRQAQVVNVPMPEHGMPYAIFALVGTTIWGLFTQVTLMATGSIANAGSLVSKIYFPREVLVLSAVGNALINVVIRFGVVLLSFALFLYAPHWQIVFLPLVLLPVVALGVGLGLFFAPINTMMHDMGRALEFAFQFGMFLAPTVYPTPDLATATGHWQQILYWMHVLNPVSHFMYAANDLIQYGTFHLTHGFIVSSVASLLILMFGWRFFHICEPLLAERL